MRKICSEKEYSYGMASGSVCLGTPLRLPLPPPLLVAQEAPAAKNASCHRREPVHKNVLRH